ncbi:MAG: J domain-containing protein [Hydrogenophilales bacterium]|nr:J domain-containing protein [Hydrogenophilales bacterium]
MMRRFRTHYDNLKVPRHATPEAIQQAYRRLSMRHHPDRNPGNEQANSIMAVINQSYRVLSDPWLRAEHDRWIGQRGRNDSAPPRPSRPTGAATGISGPPLWPGLYAYFGIHDGQQNGAGLVSVDPADHAHSGDDSQRTALHDASEKLACATQPGHERSPGRADPVASPTGYCRNLSPTQV